MCLVQSLLEVLRPYETPLPSSDSVGGSGTWSGLVCPGCWGWQVEFVSTSEFPFGESLETTWVAWEHAAQCLELRVTAALAGVYDPWAGRRAGRNGHSA
jgi:hypothetical protein